MLQTLLTQCGCTPNQAKIYLALLALKSASASTIARKARINRVTGYDTLKQLQDNEMVTATQKNNVTFYAPIDPEIILERQIQVTEQFKTSLWDFHRLMNMSPLKPRISFAEWVDAVKKMYDDLLTEKTCIKSLLGSVIVNTELKTFIDTTFDKKRIAKKIKQQVIFSSLTTGNNELIKQPARKRAKLLIKDRLLWLECGVHIYWEDKVMLNFFGGKQVAALIIQNQFFHNTLLAFFSYTREHGIPKK